MTRGGVLVVGGGITGLVAARSLAMRGVPVALVEAGDRLGGKIATAAVDGFLVEDGPDSFLTTRQAALDLVHELGLDAELIVPGEPRRVFIRRGTALIPIPEGTGLGVPTVLGPIARTRLFSSSEKLRIAGELLRPRVLGRDDVAVGHLLRARFGSALVDRLAGPLLGGVYGTPVDELSLDAVMPQLRAAEQRHRSLLLAGMAARGTASAATGTRSNPPSTFASLRGGMATLVDALDAAIRAAGVEVILGRRIDALARAVPGVAVRFADGATSTFDGLVLATPGPITAGLLEGELPGAAHPLAAIPHGSSVVVSLGYRGSAIRRPMDGHGYLVPAGEASTASACTWSSAKWPGRAPAGDVLVRVSLRADGRGRWDAMPDDAVVAAARREVEATLGISAPPRLTRVARWSRSMPRYTVGHLERVAAVEAGLSAWPAVVVAGASYRGMGLPDCIAQGTLAAERLAGGLALSRDGIPARPLAATA